MSPEKKSKTFRNLTKFLKKIITVIKIICALPDKRFKT